MPVAKFLARPANRRVHNLLRTLPLPRGAKSLLGFGLKFCVKQPVPTNITDGTFARFNNDIRREWYFHLNPPTEAPGEYNPRLYL